LGAGATRRGPSAKVAKVFNPRDPKIRDVGRALAAALALTRRQVILRLVLQYLKGEGYVISYVTLQDEARLKQTDEAQTQASVKKMRRAILGT
jgi:hypothetical protein